MRLLFSGVPAYGHLLPLIPLARAAVAAGHTVGVLTGTGMAHLIATELGADSAEHLAAGASPDVFSADAAARTEADVFKPTPAIIGKIFGGSRVDLGAEESLDVAASWAPDLIIAETFDAIGPMVAAAQGIPWHHAGIGPALPAAIADAITETAAARYAQRGLTYIRPASYLDPCPPTLQNPDWTPHAPRIAVRPQAHRTPGAAGPDLPPVDPDRPRALVTFGTIFSEPEFLDAVVSAVAAAGLEVVATRGMFMRLSSDTESSDAVPANEWKAVSDVHYVDFVPLDLLLDGVAVVVGSGGSGTVIAAMSRGIPMVLWPQGADQPINAARAAAAGVAALVSDTAEIPAALSDVLHDRHYGAAAARTATEIAAMPEPAEAVRTITDSR